MGLVRIRSVEVVEGLTVRLGFSDGTSKDVDLDPYMHGPIFEPLRRDPGLFRQVAVDEGLGTIVFPNGADVDPDVLYRGLTPAWRDASTAER